MNNKGQTTVFFSLMISVLLLFTLTALEVGRIYMSKVKVQAVVHSAQTSIMADYNRELFERYHLLFYDPTYGTGSEAVAEERIAGYIEESLNGGDGKLYEYQVEDIALTNTVSITDEDMKQLKEQIREYEKTAGIVKKANDIWEKATQGKEQREHAQMETEHNGQEIPGMDPETEHTEGLETSSDPEKIGDPRETLKESLKLGILSYVLPANVSVSKEKRDYSKSPSARYSYFGEMDVDTNFQDITQMKKTLEHTSHWLDGLPVDQFVFADYANAHFSNMVHPKENSVMPCETEYIIAGKDNDYANVESIATQITWLRMPVNYAYLLQDNAKKSEALTVAAGICTATGTPALMEVVKYLLLGCWAYGESLHEVKLLYAGENIPYIKNAANWYTDLQSLAANGTGISEEKGMDYESMLMILLAKEANKEIVYARMLDVMEKNLQVNMPSFRITDLIGKASVQGKVTVNPLFVTRGDEELYEYYFEESFSYSE